MFVIGSWCNLTKLRANLPQHNVRRLWWARGGQGEHRVGGAVPAALPVTSNLAFTGARVMLEKATVQKELAPIPAPRLTSTLSCRSVFALMTSVRNACPGELNGES